MLITSDTTVLQMTFGVKIIHASNGCREWDLRKSELALSFEGSEHVAVSGVI